MRTHSSQPGGTVGVVTRVSASGSLRPLDDRRDEFEALQATHPGTEYEEQLKESLLSPDRVHVTFTLAAELSDGRKVRATRPRFELTFWRRGRAAVWHRRRGPWRPRFVVERTYRLQPSDMRDALEETLGHADWGAPAPPRDVWRGLIDALDAEGVHTTEQELLAAPLTVELDAEVNTELQRR
jgi:hypothetical protein